jgi:hypothetical protein
MNVRNVLFTVLLGAVVLFFGYASIFGGSNMASRVYGPKNSEHFYKGFVSKIYEMPEVAGGVIVLDTQFNSSGSDVWSLRMDGEKNLRLYVSFDVDSSFYNDTLFSKVMDAEKGSGMKTVFYLSAKFSDWEGVLKESKENELISWLDCFGNTYTPDIGVDKQGVFPELVRSKLITYSNSLNDNESIPWLGRSKLTYTDTTINQGKQYLDGIE